MIAHEQKSRKRQLLWWSLTWIAVMIVVSVLIFRLLPFWFLVEVAMELVWLFFWGGYGAYKTYRIVRTGKRVTETVRSPEGQAVIQRGRSEAIRAIERMRAYAHKRPNGN